MVEKNAVNFNHSLMQENIQCSVHLMLIWLFMKEKYTITVIKFQTKQILIFNEEHKQYMKLQS